MVVSLNDVPSISTIFPSLYLKLLEKTLHGCKCVNKKGLFLLSKYFQLFKSWFVEITKIITFFL